MSPITATWWFPSAPMNASHETFASAARRWGAKRWHIPAVLLLAMMICSCSSQQPVSDEPQSAYPIPLPAGCLEGFLSPDARWLACLGTLGDESGIWVQEVEGDRVIPVVLESEGSNYHSLGWAPDGGTLASISFEGLPPGRDYEVSLFSLAAEESTVLYEGADSIRGMRWAPGGDSLAVVDGDRLHLVGLNGSHEVLLEEDVALHPLSGNGLTWSPDGHRLVFPVSVGEPRELRVLELSTLEEKVLWPNSDGRAAFIPSWSLDGQRIAILKGRYLVDNPSEERVSLVVLDADGSHPMEMDLAGAAFELGTELLWSPDGTQLATTLRSGAEVDVWLMPVEGGTPRQLTETGTVQKIIRWTTDGEAVLISTWEAIEVILVGS